MDILKPTDPVDREVGICTTIGLSDQENLVEVKSGQEDIRVELLAAAHKRFDYAPNLLHNKKGSVQVSMATPILISFV